MELAFASRIPLPTASPRIAVCHGRACELGPAGGPILVAEDDELDAALVRHRLEREGYAVDRFGDGAAALAEAGRSRFAMAILDVRLPRMDGFELLRRLREIPSSQNLPILMLTSPAAKSEIARGIELGADDCMTKPFSPAELVLRVRRLIGGSRMPGQPRGRSRGGTP